MMRIVTYSCVNLAAGNKHRELQDIWVNIGHHCKVPQQSRYSNKRIVAERLIAFASANLTYHNVEDWVATDALPAPEVLVATSAVEGLIVD